MTQNFLLSGTLTDFQLKLLDLIQYLYQETKGADRITSRNKEPVITLSYAYIVSLLGGSHSSIKTALDRLYELWLIDEVEKDYSQCATYRYNPNVYRSLIRKAKARKCTLFSGRPKKGTPRQAREVEAETVLKYMTGKAIIKGTKRK